MERCHEMWAAGSTAAEIGAELGCTRNSVLSKVHRSGWALRGPSESPRVHTPRVPRPRPRRLPEVRAFGPAPELQAPPDATAAAIAATSFAPGGPKPLLALAPSGECRWPLSHPGLADFGFCAAPCFVGKPYCADHLRIAYDRPSKRREFVPWKRKT